MTKHSIDTFEQNANQLLKCTHPQCQCIRANELSTMGMTVEAINVQREKKEVPCRVPWHEQMVLVRVIYHCMRCRHAIERYRALDNTPTYGHLCTECWREDINKTHYIMVSLALTGLMGDHHYSKVINADPKDINQIKLNMNSTYGKRGRSDG